MPPKDVQQQAVEDAAAEDARDDQLVVVPRSRTKEENANAHPLLTALRAAEFRAPKEFKMLDEPHARGGVANVCHIAFPPGKRLLVLLPGANVAAIGDGSCKTRYVTLDVTREQAKELSLVDKHVLAYVKAHADGWFARKIASSVIEDGYLPLAVADAEARAGVRARLLVGCKNLSALSPGDTDVVLQLVGLHFRKQTFALVWRFVCSSKKDEPDFIVADDDNDEPIAEDGAPLPSWEEYESLRECVLRDARAVLNALEARAAAVRDAARKLRVADNQDMEALELASQSVQHAAVEAALLEQE